MPEQARRLLDRVTKRYTRTGPKVLDDVTLDVSNGEHVLIVGSNGSGKSTLLSTMAKASRPTSGLVRTSARSATHPNVCPRIFVLPLRNIWGIWETFVV
jgi:ABC-type bacteriocin/lantibiotic exporter with double-glycine peptidase domain